MKTIRKEIITLTDGKRTVNLDLHLQEDEKKYYAISKIQNKKAPYPVLWIEKKFDNTGDFLTETYRKFISSNPGAFIKRLVERKIIK
jgi:hypothetical protein